MCRWTLKGFVRRWCRRWCAKASLWSHNWLDTFAARTRYTNHIKISSLQATRDANRSFRSFSFSRCCRCLWTQQKRILSFHLFSRCLHFVSRRLSRNLKKFVFPDGSLYSFERHIVYAWLQQCEPTLICLNNWQRREFVSRWLVKQSFVLSKEFSMSMLDNEQGEREKSSTISSARLKCRRTYSSRFSSGVNTTKSLILIKRNEQRKKELWNFVGHMAGIMTWIIQRHRIDYHLRVITDCSRQLTRARTWLRAENPGENDFSTHQSSSCCWCCCCCSVQLVLCSVHCWISVMVWMVMASQLKVNKTRLINMKK